MSSCHIFGPVASRRLGISLGVDLVTAKTCSLNCVYCESGATNNLTVERKEYVPVKEVIAQLDEMLKERPKLDFITFSGHGEPLLNSHIGEVVRFVKGKYPEYKICLLTNAVAFSDPKVVEEVLDIDLVVPSLDASCEEEFIKINRPAKNVTLNQVITGLEAFGKKSSADIILEIFIVPGINDSMRSIEKFAGIIKNIRVSKVQLNTLDRPGAVDWIKPASKECFERFVKVLSPIVPVESVGVYEYQDLGIGKNSKLTPDEIAEKIKDLAERRPVTIDDIIVALKLEREPISAVVKRLLESEELIVEKQKRGEFFRLKKEIK